MASSTAAETAKPAQAAGKKKATSKRGRKARKAMVAKKAPAPRKRTLSTPADRAKILAAADKEGLTALQVQQRFGVKPVTYYSWRKQLGLKGKRGRRPASGARASAGTAFAGLDIAGQVRQALRTEIARVLPSLIQEALASMLGEGTGRRRK